MFLQRERTFHQYVLAREVEKSPMPTVTLRSTDGGVTQPFVFSLACVFPDVFRTTFSSASHPTPPYPSVAKPTVSTAAGTLTIQPNASKATIQTTVARAEVDWAGAPMVSLFLADDGSGGASADGAAAAMPIYQDLPYRSYAVNGPGVTHYVVLDEQALHVGLGEQPAPMDLTGRSFAIATSDSVGYESWSTSPLYKHMPLLVTVKAGGAGGCVAVFSTSHARASWSVGCEKDGLWGPYSTYRQSYGGLEQYLIVGRTVADVLRSYAGLVGFPLLVPRYMMGYIGGGMAYSMSDQPRASDVIVDFLDAAVEQGMPCSAFQLSSGYTVAETEPKTRNVFTWNQHRFPDQRGFTRQCHGRGVRLLANVKPYVLASHPAYATLAVAGAFFTDPVTGQSAVVRLWSAGLGSSGEGSHLDFTSRAAYDWWQAGVRALKAVGIDAIWNDNNEVNVHNDDWECALETVPVPASLPVPMSLSNSKNSKNKINKGGDGLDNGPGFGGTTTTTTTITKTVALWGRAMHTELMAKASHDILVLSEPEIRPLVLTRSATVGTMRFAACSWSGDNSSGWKNIKGGNALALNAGFSLIQWYGHDTGGFAGAQPTAEELVRWVQLSVHSPRFAINSYKTSTGDTLVGTVVRPWMYPKVAGLVRTAIRRRYELVPYTYSQALRASRTATPSQRWLGWGYEQSDPAIWADPTVRAAADAQYWFGDALLVAGVYESGATATLVYLPTAGPTDPGYVNLHSPYQFLAAGRWHDIATPLHGSIPVLARVGAAVPVGKPVPTTCMPAGHASEFGGLAADDWRGIEIFPPSAAAASSAPRLVENGAATDAATMHMHMHMYTASWLEDDGEGASASVLGPDGRRGPHIAVSGYVEVHVQYGGDATRLRVAVAVTRAGTWSPLWLDRGVDVVLPVGEARPVDGATNGGPDEHGRSVWHVAVQVREQAQEQTQQ